MVNDLRELLRDNVAAPPHDDLDLAAVLAAAGAGCAAGGSAAVGGTALATAAVVVTGSLVLDRRRPTSRRQASRRPDAPTLRLADAAAGGRGTRLPRAGVVHQREPRTATTASTSTGSPTTG